MTKRKTSSVCFYCFTATNIQTNDSAPTFELLFFQKTFFLKQITLTLYRIQQIRLRFFQSIPLTIYISPLSVFYYLCLCVT